MVGRWNAARHRHRPGQHDPSRRETESAHHSHCRFEQHAGLAGQVRGPHPPSACTIRERATAATHRLDQNCRSPGGARLSLATLGDEGVIVADSSDASSPLGLHGTQPWTRYQLEIPVDTMAQRISVTASLQGTGSAWFDANTLTMDGRAISDVPVAAAPTSANVDWLASHSFSLRSFAPAPVDTQVDLDDLAPVARIVGDARIIALGEATHGTREFFLMKHRLLQYFVRELGATVFAIEANQLAAERINAYVRGGAGEARTVMGGMFQVWNTEEMLALIEWMRAYNAQHPERMVDFVGYDMQDQKPPIDSVRAFLDRTDPRLAVTAGRLYGDYRKAAANFNPQVSDSVRLRWRDDAETMWREMVDRRQSWLAAAPTREDSAKIEWAVQNANVVRQAAISNYTMDVPQRVWGGVAGAALRFAGISKMLRVDIAGVEGAGIQGYLDQ